MRVSAAALRAGVEQRRIELDEDLARRIAEFGRGLMGELGIDPNSDRVRLAVRRQLMLVGGSDPDSDPGSDDAA